MTDKDTITLPREVACQVPLHELLAAVPADARLVIDDADGKGTRFIPVGRLCREAATALRAALAAEQPKPEPVAWMFVNLDGECEQIEYGTPPTDDDSITPLYIAPPSTHPGYVIGSHWLETAYSRICAGEAEADVLRDCGWERVDQALRRDADRLWEALKHYGKHDDDCGDHDAYNSESLRHCGCGLDAVLDETLGEKR